VPPITADPLDIASGIAAGSAEQGGKPVVSCFMGGHQGDVALKTLVGAGIPNYVYPESAVRSLAALNRYANWRDKPQGAIQDFNVNRELVQQILRDAQDENREHLNQVEVFQILSAYGITIPAYHIGHEVEEAVKAAGELGYPVALKIDSHKLIHKSDAGGVKLGINSETELRDAWENVMSNPVVSSLPAEDINRCPDPENGSEWQGDHYRYDY